MIEELQSASAVLSSALDQYIAACTAIANYYDPSSTLKSVSQKISDMMSNEIDLIAWYDRKLRKANLLVNRTRNAIPAAAPIHMLPPDILSHIFRLVCDTQPGYFKDTSGLKPFPVGYPEALSYVCWRWRQIAIGSRVLWSRIDIPAYPSTYHTCEGLLARAKVFMTRAESLPVDLYMMGYPHDESPCSDLNAFCATIASRIRSLHLLIPVRPPRVKYHASVLQNYLVNCKPGSLNELVLVGVIKDGPHDTIEASEDPLLPNSLLLEMPHGYLEDRLRPIKVVKLTGVYFHWASQAYHGLVELHLIPVFHGENLPITQSQLKAVLAASPRLRALHFGLEIVDMLPRNNSCMAVSLNDLEVVNFCSMKWGPRQAHNALLQLLAPGSKPLQLSISFPLKVPISLLGTDTMEFISRSNMTKLHIERFGSTSSGEHLGIRGLLGLFDAPNLRALSLRHFSLKSTQPNHTSDQSQDNETSSQVGGIELELHPTCPRLDIVHLRDCSIDFPHLLHEIEVVPIQKLNHSSCKFYTQDVTYHDQNLPLPNKISCTFNHITSPWLLDVSDPWA